MESATWSVETLKSDQSRGCQSLCPVRVQLDCGDHDTSRAGKAWLGALLDRDSDPGTRGKRSLTTPSPASSKVWSAPCLALDLLYMFSVM
eukprot:1235466-Rhodomonas_salina.1